MSHAKEHWEGTDILNDNYVSLVSSAVHEQGAKNQYGDKPFKM
jgi:hypothetical protein